ncbi:SusD/RagB family nutrient-binding outer membrane lipoprotein [Larkinella humicola]|uniref:SusD/RagB family nutrient-binding outer membrane lipoprotein n=1 Tax=Larkinella humicola TaxID=2607654 RepID=A0A5N1JAB6_9BACT|nr:SusD/RagB family nutrient-binding outer membrane lipoprotein [Larkinella humicola]KAA9349617.1 SusD/RagB family nutrient-binding outer membrane lipoprotein [Larkinella humicola]
MNAAKTILITLIATLGLVMTSCENLNEVNKNPNAAEEVSSNYVLTYVLTRSARVYYNLGAEGSKIAGAMQYNQVGTDLDAAAVNQYGWGQESWNEYYDILRNNKIIYDNAVRDNNNFFKAVSLTIRASLFGLLTDLYGDIPYSEALNAKTGTFFPKYDPQLDVYKGVLKDLQEANTLLSALTAKDAINATSDVLYKGDAAKWKKFANSLRLRYCLRVSSKKAEMSAAGINLEEEFKNAASAVFTSNADDALINFLGTNGENSALGGLLNSPSPKYFIKPSRTFVSKLLSTGDPRLERWAQPVLNKWDSRVKKTVDSTVKNRFGDSFTVKFIPATASSVDTSLYVGLPIGLPVVQAMAYNKGTDAATYNPERNPYISFIHDRYRKNTDPYVNINWMTYAEVEFILAEAALAGNFGVAGTAEEHYKKGIKASLEKVAALGATGFDFEKFYAQPGVSYAAATTKLERILEQKWIAGWLTVQSWFDWRRTGYPNLKTGPVAQSGAALPIRFMYPTPNLDPSYLVNYNQAVSRLETSAYIPAGQSKDHPYGKMWLLQGTSKPW